MRPFLWLAPLVGVVCLPLVASAQVIVRAPGVRVQVGPPAQPQPYYPPAYPATVPVTPGIPVPIPFPPEGIPVPLPDPTPVAPAKVPTVEEFVACFKPLPGKYDVWIIHPGSGCPVRVCFCLPDGCGCPRVCVHKREITFDYGKREVTIRFALFGKVKVFEG